MANEDQTVSVFKLGLALLLGGLALKYFFFPSPNTTNTTSNTTSPNSTSTSRAREADVETVQQMFPQIPRRSIMWDLQRNGGSVAATTERILSGRGLDNPPQTFQPPLPPPSPSTAATVPASTTARATPPDLITRYNLADKIANPDRSDDATPVVTSAGKQAWSQNKGERSALLQKRREEMILAARKKMEAKVAAESAQKSAIADI